ncbi:hypothetical protein ACJRO7_018147 [Eucalyptus globulus]
MAMICFATARETVKYKRALPPAHFSLNIESFEALSTLDKYDSGVFKAAGHDWRLSLYPKGNKDDNSSGYISLYLSIKDIPLNKTVDVTYKLFVHDKSRNNYLTIQDADEAISSFHGAKTQHGFPRFLSLKEFEKRSNGYLDEKSSCTFGAEVFVIQPAEMEESLTLIRHPTPNQFSLEIENWSKVGTDPRSYNFDCEDRKWKLTVYPKVDGKSLSVYLKVEDPTEKQIYADFKLRVLDGLKKNLKEKRFKCWLSASHPEEGDADFMLLKDLEKLAKGFIENDTLVVQVQICVVSSKQCVVPSPAKQPVVPPRQPSQQPVVPPRQPV